MIFPLIVCPQDSPAEEITMRLLNALKIRFDYQPNLFEREGTYRVFRAADYYAIRSRLATELDPADRMRLCPHPLDKPAKEARV